MSKAMKRRPLDPHWPEQGFVKRHVRPTSTVRTKPVSRVAAQIIMAGVQDTQVRIVPRGDGQGESVSMRVGQLLIYLEDSEALTTLIEVAAHWHTGLVHGRSVLLPTE